MKGTVLTPLHWIMKLCLLSFSTGILCLCSWLDLLFYSPVVLKFAGLTPEASSIMWASRKPTSFSHRLELCPLSNLGWSWGGTGKPCKDGIAKSPLWVTHSSRPRQHAATLSYRLKVPTYINQINFLFICYHLLESGCWKSDHILGIKVHM